MGSTSSLASKPAALPLFNAFTAITFVPARRRDLRSNVLLFLHASISPPLFPTSSPLTNKVNWSSTLSVSVAREIVASTGRGIGRRKNRSPRGASAAGLPSGYQIHCAPSNGERVCALAFPRPIHCACQSALFNSPISHQAGALSAILPSWSHTRTFQWHRWRETSALPA